MGFGGSCLGFLAAAGMDDRSREEHERGDFDVDVAGWLAEVPTSVIVFVSSATSEKMPRDATFTSF